MTKQEKSPSSQIKHSDAVIESSSEEISKTTENSRMSQVARDDLALLLESKQANECRNHCTQQVSGCLTHEIELQIQQCSETERAAADTRTVPRQRKADAIDSTDLDVAKRNVTEVIKVSRSFFVPSSITICFSAVSELCSSEQYSPDA